MTIVDKLSDKLFLADNDCWEFVGAISGSGYGNLTYDKVQYSTHVLSYIIEYGPVPKGMVVRHTCHNKICCNPAHLIVGTYQDNKDDEIALGTHVKGSRQGHAKLLEDDIPIIRKLISDGFRLVEIGRLYHVTAEAIGLIKSGKNWSWL